MIKLEEFLKLIPAIDEAIKPHSNILVISNTVEEATFMHDQLVKHVLLDPTKKFESSNVTRRLAGYAPYSWAVAVISVEEASSGNRIRGNTFTHAFMEKASYHRLNSKAASQLLQSVLPQIRPHLKPLPSFLTKFTPFWR